MCVVQPPDPQTTVPHQVCACLLHVGVYPRLVKTGGVLTLPAGPCQAAPTVGMILKGAELAGGGRVSLVWEGVSLCGGVRPSAEGCVPVWGVPQCKRVCPSVGACVPVWRLSQCGRVFPSVGGCVPVWEGVP